MLRKFDSEMIPEKGVYPVDFEEFETPPAPKRTNDLEPDLELVAGLLPDTPDTVESRERKRVLSLVEEETPLDVINEVDLKPKKLLFEIFHDE
jgi:hypothetical protein